MPTINLDQKGISVDGAEFNAIASNLQSNILKSHSRDHARLLFLKFSSEKTEVSAWIRNFINQTRFVISALDQKNDSAEHKANAEAGIEKNSRTVANFYLTAQGYSQLGLAPENFTDSNFDDDEIDEEENENESITVGNNDFVRGMRSDGVNKKLDDPETGQWEQEYNTDIHAMVLLADDDSTRLNTEIENIKGSMADVAVVIKEEIGNNLTAIFGQNKRNLEHFGYADGISQPRYFTEDERTSPIDLQPLNIILVKDPFADNGDNNFGSFLVYRKLEQDVEGFNNKITELSENLVLNANQEGKITKEDFAGALVVGRFKDGTPLIESDVPLDAFPPFNNFMYENTDRPARKCPFHSHIRKSNPRGQGILVPERYITRRGIPYGEMDSSDDKGLLFMCFQSNLNKQFNFIQKTWANSPGFPPFRGTPGLDPVIGQGGEGEQSWPIEYGSRNKIDFNFSGFVKMKGGEYFFAPSISFLKNI